MFPLLVHVMLVRMSDFFFNHYWPKSLIYIFYIILFFYKVVIYIQILVFNMFFFCDIVVDLL